MRLEKRRFEPEDRGRVVTAFLESFFTRYVAYDFTADLEEKLDDISGGHVDWKTLLRDFLGHFRGVNETKDLRISEVLDKLDDLWAPISFATLAMEMTRAIAPCADGRLNLKLGNSVRSLDAPTIPIAALPDRWRSPTDLTNPMERRTQELGIDPETNLMVTLRRVPTAGMCNWARSRKLSSRQRVRNRKPRKRSRSVVPSQRP